MIARGFISSVCMAFVTTACAQSISIPGNNAGSDGALAFVPDVPSGSVMTINLDDARTEPSGVTWESLPTTAGKGVYDPVQWAVVFKYTSVTVPAGKTIKFLNHRTHAPVVWLVTGSVTINGVVDVSGAAHNDAPNSLPSEPGPGGFRGGRPGISIISQSGAGFGPGGSRMYSSVNPATNRCFWNRGIAWAGYARAGTTNGPADQCGTPGPAYGSASIIPLIGGSGGGGILLEGCSFFGGVGGGAGGGAILIAAQNTITVGDPAVVGPGTAKLLALGGDGYGCQPQSSGGSGGAIRLVAQHITGNGLLRANGGANCPPPNVSSDGRIRLELVDDSGFSGNANPASSPVLLADGEQVKLWPTPSEPQCRVTRIVPFVGAPRTVDPDPKARLSFANTDVRLDAPGQNTVEIECRNVDELWTVDVRVIPNGGWEPVTVTATRSSGNFSLSTWTANVAIPPGVSAIQVRAHE